jgi:hypothetical protein
MAAIVISIISIAFSALAAAAAWIAARESKRSADASEREVQIEESRRWDELDALRDAREMRKRAVIMVSLRMRDMVALGDMAKGTQVVIGNSGSATATAVKVHKASYGDGQAIALAGSDIGNLEPGERAACEMVVPTSLSRPVLVAYEWTDGLGRHVEERRVLPPGMA